MSVSREHRLATARAWKKNNQEKAKAYQLAWREKNKEHVARYSREYDRTVRPNRLGMLRVWEEKNPDRVREYKARWYQENKVRTKERYKKYYADHKDEFLERAKLRKGRHRGATGKHTMQQWLARIAYFGWSCGYCATILSPKSVTKDHQIPLIRGGTDWASNLIPACLSCNLQKHTMMPSVFRSRQLGRK